MPNARRPVTAKIVPKIPVEDTAWTGIRKESFICEVFRGSVEEERVPVRNRYSLANGKLLR